MVRSIKTLSHFPQKTVFFSLGQMPSPSLAAQPPPGVSTPFPSNGVGNVPMNGPPPGMGPIGMPVIGL